MVRVLALVAVPALAAALAGCGGGTASGPADSVRPETELTIDVWATGRGKGEPRRYTLSCSPSRGTVPRPERACALLAAKGKALFAPVARDVACTAIYGGPQAAEIAGRIDGQPLAAQLNRTNGCEIARWQRVEPVVPLPPWKRRS